MAHICLGQYAVCKNLTIRQTSVVRFDLQKGIDIYKEVFEHTGGNKPIEAKKQFEEFILLLGSGNNLIVDKLDAKLQNRRGGKGNGLCLKQRCKHV